MFTARKMLAVWSALLIASCVTINVYFPAAAAEKAADRFIDEVWGEEGAPPEDAPAPEPQSSRVSERVLAFFIPSAHAQADINISTPGINKLQKSMRNRHKELLPFYDAGALGLTGMGLVAVHDAKVVPIGDRATLQQLVAAENRDRNALYKEIAQANGHPEWESDIRKTFANQWVAKARTGWWYKLDAGWRQK
jgi:uncharacterized protein YdbL (DUF1318 family)